MIVNDCVCYPVKYLLKHSVISLYFCYFVTQKAVLVCAMEMVGALWVTMVGTVYASWAGGALAVTRLWKLPAVMSRTMTEVKITNITLNKHR